MKISEVNVAELDAVLSQEGLRDVGLPRIRGFQRVIREMYEAGKVVSVCHGPIVFANVKLSTDRAWSMERNDGLHER